MTFTHRLKTIENIDITISNERFDQDVNWSKGKKETHWFQYLENIFKVICTKLQKGSIYYKK